MGTAYADKPCAGCKCSGIDHFESASGHTGCAGPDGHGCPKGCGGYCDPDEWAAGGG